MRELHLDYETYGTVNLKTDGAHRYTQDPSFMILMAAWAYDDEPVQSWDYTEGEMPRDLVAALTDARVIKYAHNAAFELAATDAYFRQHGLGGALPLDFSQWRCTMVWAATLGLPRRLEKLAEYLRVSPKDAEGKRLINLFSKPIASGKRKGERRLPEDHPEDWKRYRSYNEDDVEAERQAHRKLRKRPMPDAEWELWAIDQEINFTGLRVDVALAEHAVAIDAAHVERRVERMKELTGLQNPNSVQQLAEWLAERGFPMENLRAESLQDWLEHAHYTDTDDGTPHDFALVREVLELRLENGNKSTSKYKAMLRTVGRGDRVRGLFQFYGADTGRWAGRLVQVQNLPRGGVTAGKAEKAALAAGATDEEAHDAGRKAEDDLRARLRSGDPTLDSGHLKELIRSAFIPEDGREFVVSDFSAIEARVLAWVAGEEWALEAFATHGKIYEATAAAMLGKTLDEVTKDDRQRGKVAVLALGYQGWVGALLNMGALAMGLAEEELPDIAKQWRNANKKIVKFWGDVEKAARVPTGGVRWVGKIKFEKEKSGALYITLPSGRALAYPGFRVYEDAEGKVKMSYWNFAKGFREETYGGKLTENIVQAIARDLIAYGIVSLHLLGYRIVAHVHDEVITEERPGGSVEALNEVLVAAPAWADGLPLNAEGDVMKYYHK